MAHTQNSEKIRTLVQMAMVTAIILVLGLTPIGYPKIGTVDMTILSIPVIIGAIVLGPKAGAFFGGIFGLTSFLACFNGISPFGAALVGMNIFYTAVICFVPRILMGWGCGMIFKTLYNHRVAPFWSGLVAGLSASLINTVGFTGLVFAFFWNSPYIQGMAAGQNILAFALIFVGINGLIEAITCTILSATISRALLPFILKNHSF